jgi:hypothetical protein
MLTTGSDQGIERNEFFLISITSTIKKSNRMIEPHGSPKGCAVRPRKGIERLDVGAGGYLTSHPGFCV